MYLLDLSKLTDTHWISLLQVAATAFVGIVAGFITWKMQSKQIDIAKGLQEIARGQHQTAATKLRLELFERRYKSYEALIHSIESIDAINRQVNDQMLVEMRKNYNLACKPIKYLFDEEISCYLTKAVDQILINHIVVMDEFYNNKKIGDEREQQKIEFNKTCIAINDVYIKLDDLVGPYLKI